MKSREKKKGVLLDRYFRQQVERMNGQNSYFTAANYRNTLQSVLRFAGKKSENLRVDDITSEWVSAYVGYMLDTEKLSEGTADCYYRTLRAAYNKAVREYGIEEAAGYPFKCVNIAVPPTLKRALSENDICHLRDMKLTGEKACARDLFMFLFYARGMCFVDVFNLKKKDVHNGYINYKRSKTGNPLQVKIIPEARVLIERYSESDSPYVFAFLHRNRYKQGCEVTEQSALKRINRNLGVLGEELGFPNPLTTYVARHTWATLVEACGTTTAIISQALGHSSERVTRTYMKGLPSHVIDGVNDEMLDSFIREKTNKRRDRKDKKKRCLTPSKNETSLNAN